MNCVEALGSLFYIIHMRTFRESTQIFCSGLNGAQLALPHAPTLGSVGNGGEGGCGGGGSSGGDGCGGGRPSAVTMALGWATPPPAPTGGYVHKGVLAGGAGGRSPPGEKIADLFTFTRIFHGRRRRGTPRASERFMCQRLSAVERVLGSVFHVGRRAACALVLHCSQPLGHTACQAC